ncbi:MAG: hypothetical protein ACI4V7_08260 [Succinivibrionaceae bacterium]
MQRRYLPLLVMLAIFGMSEVGMASDDFSLSLRDPRAKATKQPKTTTSKKVVNNSTARPVIKIYDADKEQDKLSTHPRNLKGNSENYSTIEEKFDTKSSNSKDNVNSANDSKKVVSTDNNGFMKCEKPIFPDPVIIRKPTVPIVDLKAVAGKHTVAAGEDILSIINFAKPDNYDDIYDEQVFLAIYRANPNAFTNSGIKVGVTITIPTKERIKLEDKNEAIRFMNLYQANQLKNAEIPELDIPWKEEAEAIAQDIERKKERDAIVEKLTNEYNACLAYNNVLRADKVNQKLTNETVDTETDYFDNSPFLKEDPYAKKILKEEQKNLKNKSKTTNKLLNEQPSMTTPVIISNVDKKQLAQTVKELDELKVQVSELTDTLNSKYLDTAEGQENLNNKVLHSVNILNTRIEDLTYRLEDMSKIVKDNQNFVYEYNKNQDMHNETAVIKIISGVVGSIVISLVALLLFLKIRSKRMRKALMDDDLPSDLDTSLNDTLTMPSIDDLKASADPIMGDQEVPNFESNISITEDLLNSEISESAELIPSQKTVKPTKQQVTENVNANNANKKQSVPDFTEGNPEAATVPKEPRKYPNPKLRDTSKVLSEEEKLAFSDPDWGEALKEQAQSKVAVPDDQTNVEVSIESNESDPSWEDALNEQASSKATEPEPSWEDALNEQASSKATEPEPSWEDALNEQASSKATEPEPSWEDALNEQASSKATEPEPSWEDALNEQASAKATEPEPSWEDALNEQASSKATEPEPSWEDALNEQASAKATEPDPSWEDALNEQASAKSGISIQLDEPSWEDALSEQKNSKKQ